MVMHTRHVRVQHASVLLGIGKVDGTVDLEGSDLDWSLAFDDLARRVDQHQVVCRHLRPEKAIPIDKEPVGASRQQGGQVVTNAFIEPHLVAQAVRGCQVFTHARLRCKGRLLCRLRWSSP